MQETSIQFGTTFSMEGKTLWKLQAVPAGKKVLQVDVNLAAATEHGMASADLD